MNINVNSTVEINNYSINELNNIRETIENMNKFNQIEILRILSKESNVILNENKYGIHINLTDLDKEIINELNIFIKYVNTQELTLNSIEQQKEDYRNTYFSKDIKNKIPLIFILTLFILLLFINESYNCKKMLNKYKWFPFHILVEITGIFLVYNICTIFSKL